MSWKNPIRAWKLRDHAAQRGSAPGRPIHERLARGFCRLQDIELVRDQLGDPRFEAAAAERIVWRELLELELQDADERIERILAAAGNG